MKVNQIYIVAVVVTSGRIIQCKGRFQILRHKVISQHDLFYRLYRFSKSMQWYK